MKKISKISLHQLDSLLLRNDSGKFEECGLKDCVDTCWSHASLNTNLFGGGDPGWCKCGSCATPSGGSPSTAENEAANKENGYTITGSNDPVCVCQGGEGSAMQTVSK